MTKSKFSFYFYLLFFLGTGMLIQGFIYQLFTADFFHHHLLECYIYNAFLTAIFYFLLVYLKDNKNDILGFSFLGISTLKFLLFFVFINVLDLEREGLKSGLFASFFVPYAISLYLEIQFLVKSLNK